MEFTPLERDVLNWIASQASQENDPALAEQLKSAVAISREFTDCGSFTRMRVSEASAPRVTYRVTSLDPQIQSPEIQDGASAVLHLEDGYASLLEIFAWGGKFPADLTQWEVS